MRLLEEMGYTNLRHYVGGLADWEAHDLPVASVREVRAPAPEPPAGLFALVERLGNRTLAELAGLWVGVVATAALLFWGCCAVPGHGLMEGSRPVAFSAASLVECFYFSSVTATSVGYGDIVPVGAARGIAIVQAVLELLLFGGVVSKFVSSRQERLIEEVSETAFEGQLGRIRTNLHLILMELHTLGDLCHEGEAPHRLNARIESGAMVFLGEFRAIHTLLFASRHEPEEVILEAILASVESGLHAWSDLLERAPATFDVSPLMRAGLEKMVRLSADICSDCVPRRYEKELTAQMDRVQAAGQALRARL